MGRISFIDHKDGRNSAGGLSLQEAHKLARVHIKIYGGVHFTISREDVELDVCEEVGIPLEYIERCTAEGPMRFRYPGKCA